MFSFIFVVKFCILLQKKISEAAKMVTDKGSVSIRKRMSRTIQIKNQDEAGPSISQTSTEHERKGKTLKKKH